MCFEYQAIFNYKFFSVIPIMLQSFWELMSLKRPTVKDVRFKAGSAVVAIVVLSSRLSVAGTVEVM